MNNTMVSSLEGTASQLIIAEVISKALPGLNKNQKTVLLVDYNNLEGTLKKLGASINMWRFRDIFAQRCQLVDARLYWAFDYENQMDVNRNQALMSAGYLVTEKNHVINHQGVRKGDMDVELVMDAMEIPSSIEHVILVSGDSDFIPLINRLRRNFIQVSVCSTRQVQPPVIRHEVIKAASNFYDLADLLPAIESDRGHRSEGNE